MYLKTKSYGGEDTNLAFPDNYDTISMYVDKTAYTSAATTVDGRLILKKGNFYKDENNRVIGLTFNDVDLTDGSDNVAVLIKGAVLVGKLPITVSKENAAILKNIVFIDSGGEAIDYA